MDLAQAIMVVNVMASPLRAGLSHEKEAMKIVSRAAERELQRQSIEDGDPS